MQEVEEKNREGEGKKERDKEKKNNAQKNATSFKAPHYDTVQ